MVKKEDIHIRDPFVFVENDTYYLLGTTGDDPWGKASDLTLYTSKDLERFEKKCTLVTDGCLDSYTNIWAPELHKYKGKYYLILSAYREDKGRGSFILVSDSLDNGFTLLTGKYITPEHWEDCLDATLFVYGGKPYLYFSDNWPHTVTGDGDGSLFVTELSDDLTRTVSKPRKIVSGKHSGLAIEIGDEHVQGYIAEGPYVYEEDGKIVLLWSTIGKNGYMVIRNVSTSGVFGKYEFEKVLFDEDGGHCMRFTGLDGVTRLTFHQPNVTPKERMKFFVLQD